MRKSCLSFAIAVVALNFFGLQDARIFAESTPTIVARAKPATVRIVAYDKNESPIKSGTGFFISADGLVVTNNHVIEGAAYLAARTDDGRDIEFQRVVAQPRGIDLAVLQFRCEGASFLTLGKSIDALEGQRVIVIGNPEGLQGTVSEGIIAAFRENHTMIQITAPISPGSSGSPVIDESGFVIGVATLTSSEGQNLNFAIAVEQISTALSSTTIRLPSIPKPTPLVEQSATAIRESGKRDSVQSVQARPSPATNKVISCGEVQYEVPAWMPELDDDSLVSQMFPGLSDPRVFWYTNPRDSADRFLVISDAIYDQPINLNRWLEWCSMPSVYLLYTFPRIPSSQNVCHLCYRTGDFTLETVDLDSRQQRWISSVTETQLEQTMRGPLLVQLLNNGKQFRLALLASRYPTHASEIRDIIRSIKVKPEFRYDFP